MNVFKNSRKNLKAQSTLIYFKTYLQMPVISKAEIFSLLNIKTKTYEKAGLQ
jgi:hypothetical protein